MQISDLKKTEDTIPKKNSVLELAHAIHEAAEKTKAVDPIVIDLRKHSSYADYIIICSGTSDRQVKAISNNVGKDVFKKLKRSPLGVEGRENGFWILMDFGDVVFHIFLEVSF